MRLREIQLFWVGCFLAALGLVACQQLGVPSPETFNQKLAVAYTSVTAVRTTATQLLAARKISPDDAENVNASADVARAGLDVARRTSDPAAANAKLTAAVAALTALQTYLATKGGQ